jgi:chorismate mutase/prephenate dehydrogenase
MSDFDEAELAAIRRQLAATDEKIVELAAERVRLANELGRVKQTAGLPTRDYRQEKDVIERAQLRAAELGLEPEFAEGLMVYLIRRALTEQERDRVRATGAGDGRRVLVVGGAGKMGRWFVRFLLSQGYAVEVADPAGGVDGCRCFAGLEETALDHELIVVATPLRASVEILAALADRRPEGVVFDIGSLKTPLRARIEALVDAGVKATSIHPMFGPETELLSGKHVIFVDVGSAEATRTVRELFASTMAIQVEMDLESHDRLIAYVLGLAHAVNIAFFTALAESGEAAPRLAGLSSTTFDAQLEIARSVAGENPHLYFEIQSLNDYGTESLSALLYAVERVRSVVRAGDEDAFIRLMKIGAEYLGGVGPRD